MTQDKPSLDEFKENIESILKQQLTTPAKLAAEDFWNSWSSFNSLIADRALAVHVDTILFTHNFPEYRRYGVWRGVGIVSFVVAFIAFWFYWLVGLAIAALGYGFYQRGGNMLLNDAKNYAENLMKDATLNPSGGGYAKLCANYIAGTIRIVSPLGSAHWPQYPTNIISGERTFIPT